MSLPTENPGATGIASGASKVDHAGTAVSCENTLTKRECQRGGFWSGPTAETPMNGRRLRFFEPSRGPSFPDMAIRDFADALGLSGRLQRRVARWMRHTFAAQIRWRWSGLGFAQTVPLWAALLVIDELADAGRIDRSDRAAFLEAAATAVRNLIGEVSEGEGTEIVTASLRRLTAEIEQALPRRRLMGDA